MRLLSHTEVSKALDCQAAWDFGYGGHLAGDALKPRATAPRLREGRAWGRAVAAWHEHAVATDAFQLAGATDALEAALNEDATEQREAGVYMEDEHKALTVRLGKMLAHYHVTAEPVQLDRLEHELTVGVPSRTGARKSSRYRFEAYLDGVHVDEQGRTWLVEFKLRTRLSSLEQIVKSRQIRWYAWAYRELYGVEPAGVLVDERWNEVPKPARELTSGKPSHAKDQLTTVDRYRALCEEKGEDPKPEVIEALESRRWQARHPVIFRPGELDEAGLQLVSAAKLIQQLDSGGLYPIRNPGPQRCPGCVFREICNEPDSDLVDAYFRRVPAKRDRPIDREAVPA